MYKPPVLLLFLLFLLTLAEAEAQPNPCTNPVCVGNAYTQDVHTGRGAQYVSIERTPSQQAIRDAMTVELWVKAERQANLLQYIAGLWGPRNSPTDDQNDSWAIYIDDNDDLVFEIDGPGGSQGDVNNSIVRYAYAAHYNRWTHIAAIFDGASETVRLYVDGVDRGSNRNAAFPASQLQTPAAADLLMRLGSTNGRTDNASYRTFRGQIDEFKVWSRVLDATEIICGRDRAARGNEAGLVIYFRCNEAPAARELCDATGNNNVGRISSNGRCEESDRTVDNTILIEGLPSPLRATLECVNAQSWTFTVTDTSACGGNYRVIPAGAGRGFYSITPSGLQNFEPGVPRTFTLTVQTDLVGQLPNARIQVDRELEFGNQCARSQRLNLIVDRVTELEFSESIVIYDTLLAGCRDTPFRDTVITIRNNSRAIGTNRPVRIESISTNLPRVFRVIPERPLPTNVNVDEEFSFRVRFLSNDSTGMYRDTVRIVSDDCSPLALILLEGIEQEALSVRHVDSGLRLDSIAFEDICPLLLSEPRAWLWSNEMSFPFGVDSITLPDFIRMIPAIRSFPYVLADNFAYRANYFRFRPPTSGRFVDSIVFHATVSGCQIERKVYVSGKGISSEVEFTTPAPVDFGTIVVGQVGANSVNVRNAGEDQIRVSLNLEIGEQFFIVGPSVFNLNPGQSRTVNLEFRPLEDSCYFDKLHVFEQTCFRTDEIRLMGCGQVERFRFDPIVLRTENVVSCRSQRDTIDIINISGATQTLRNVDLVGNPGTFVAVQPAAYPAGPFTLANGERQRFIFDYVPGSGPDRVDRVFLRYEADGEVWEAPMIGASVSPRLYVTPLTVYGQVEVGSSAVQVVVVENASSISLDLDGVNLPPGFSLQNPGRLPTVLDARDTIRLNVIFTPVAEQIYGGTDQFVAFSNSPCPGVRTPATIRGEGVIRLLDVRRETIPFGYTPPCDCAVDVVPVFNTSDLLDMQVDDIRIVAGAGPAPRPQVFSWTSRFSPNGVLPYSIPADSTDTLTISFCPRTPAEDTFLQNTAVLEIDGSGAGGWSITHRVYMSGLRAIPYRPNAAFVEFPTTPVDTSLGTRRIQIGIPDVSINPEQLPITVDSITFEPDERVFSAREAGGRPFPITIAPPDDVLDIEIDFVPRAPRCDDERYEARMVIHTSSPCVDRDTTVLVVGCGEADVASLSFLLDTLRTPPPNYRPEFRMTTCDTIEVPVVASGAIPAKVVDIDLSFLYDVNQLQFIDIRSRFEAAHDSCAPFVPSLVARERRTTTGTLLGTEVEIVNFCGIQAFDDFLIARFAAATTASTSLTIRLDEIRFDSQDLLLFDIVGAGGAEGDVVIVRPEIQVQTPLVDFGQVRILDCQQADVRVENTGDTTVTIDDVIQIPADVRVLGAVPPLGPGGELEPGEASIVTLEFCPQNDVPVDSLAQVLSAFPCELIDSTRIQGLGFAPDYPVRLAFSEDFPTPVNFRRQLGEFDTIPIYLVDPLGVEYNGTQYWLQDISFEVLFDYNFRMLRIQDVVSPYASRFTFDNSRRGLLRMNFSGMDTVDAGLLAEIFVEVVVPDTVDSRIAIEAQNFVTDSLYFLDLMPEMTEDSYSTEGKCNVSFVRFPSGGGQIFNHSPNPANSTVRFEFAMRETVPVYLSIHNLNGDIVQTVLEGEYTLQGGEYSIDADVSALPPGVYYSRLHAGIFESSRKLLIIH